MKKTLHKIIAGIFLFTILVTSIQPFHADETDKTSNLLDKDRVVRVGFYHMTGFQYYDEYGELQGYCIDYLDILSSFTGWDYEYVEVADFMDGCEKLANHEIDLIAPAMMTESRKEMYDYSELDFGTEFTILVTKEGREDLYYEDYERFEGMKVAVLKDYPLTEYFISYMETHDFESDLVYFSTIDESKKALNDGEVDAIVTSIMDMEEDQKLLARFSPQPFYFLTWKGNSDFLAPLNKAMSQAQNTYPTLLDDLLVKHYPIYKLQFYSRDEVEYIENCRTLRVAYVADRKPLSFTNEEGELDGISREIFDTIAEISGLRFEYVALPEGDITYRFLLEQHIDLITGVEYNSTNMNAGGMLLSSPYLSSRKMIVSLKGFDYNTEANYKIAVPIGSQTVHKVLNTLYPNLEIVDYPNNEACFEALANEEVDLLIQNQYVVEAILSKPRYSDFVVVPMEGLADELCFSTIISLYGMEAMTEEESIQLITIINKTISQMEEQDIDNIIVRETLQNQYELDFLDLIYGYGWLITAIIIAFLFMTLFFLSLAATRSRREKQKEKEARLKDLQQKRYRTILECSDDLIYEISLEGDSNIGSEKIKDKFGWEIPKKVDDLDFTKAMQILHVHPEDELAFRQTLLANGQGSSDELTVRIQKADGEYIWCKVFRTLLMDDNNNVVSILGKIEDVDEEVKERKALELSSRTDALSGLLNKAAFKKEVKEYLAHNSAKGVGFVFMDMDHFKEINDHLGHRTGDIVIKENAKKIQLLFANFDLVSRFGGDEFCVFVKDIPRETLVDRLEFAVEKMREDYPYEEGIIHLSASIGAAYCMKDTVEYKDLFEVADTALYKVKDCGRNGYLIEDII
ncbi:MAG: transporter substrate-binding domain-containing protein [Agathobacter sp.]|nr:transporter substrate-binding domain-containing protein [Agathobacter sp.]